MVDYLNNNLQKIVQTIVDNIFIKHKNELN